MCVCVCVCVRACVHVCTFILLLTGASILCHSSEEPEEEKEGDSKRKKGNHSGRLDKITCNNQNEVIPPLVTVTPSAQLIPPISPFPNVDSQWVITGGGGSGSLLPLAALPAHQHSPQH